MIATDVKSTRARQLAPGGPFAYLDVTDRDSLARLVLEHDVTHIVHLATLLSAIGEKSPALALRVNTLGIQNVLEVAVNAGASVRPLSPPLGKPGRASLFRDPSSAGAAMCPPESSVAFSFV